MSDMALTMRQTAFNLRGGMRNARAVVFTIVMPVVLLVLFNSVFSGSDGTTKFDGATIDFAAYFTPGIIAYAIMLTGFNGLLIALTTNRERGLLKRYRGTPMPPWVFLSAQILQTVVTMFVMAAVIVAIGWAFYDVHPQRDALGGFVLYVLLGSATMCALGIAFTRITTTADSASAIGPFATVILAFVSGVFIPVASLPDWLRDVGRVFPLAHLAEGLQRAYSPATSGSGIDATNIAVLAAWGLAALVVALRTFKWEPQGAGT
jgi:ABC-2 type transport system permease protein